MDNSVHENLILGKEDDVRKQREIKKRELTKKLSKLKTIPQFSLMMTKTLLPPPYQVPGMHVWLARTVMVRGSLCIRPAFARSGWSCLTSRSGRLSPASSIRLAIKMVTILRIAMVLLEHI
jgi:hypothetical protein